MDRKSVIVLAVCFVLFALWAQLVPVMYPPKPVVRTNVVAGVSNSVPAATPTTAAAPAPTAAIGNWVPPVPGAAEETLLLTNGVARFTFTSHGGGLKQVELLKHLEVVACGPGREAASNRLATLNGRARLPVFALVGDDTLAGDNVYRISRFAGTWSEGSNQTRTVSGIRAEKQLSNGLFVVKEFELATNYLLNARVRFENRSGQPRLLPAQNWITGAGTRLGADDAEDQVGLQWWNSRSFATANSARFSEGGFACMPGTPLAQVNLGETNVHWITAHNQFFVLALMPELPLTGLVASKYDLPLPPTGGIKKYAIEGVASHPAMELPAGQSVTRAFTLYAGPREYRTLELLGARMKNHLERVMDFGMFGFFSKLLLLSMNGLNSLGLSYGLAIIAITVIIKLLFWPLTQASMRSMKRMQKLQPQMKSIQEKYKEDPAKMNKKMMEFMKENKVSPLGGCLPLLLQIPVFIGFFTMVRSAIELRGASFLWACDLSRPDTVFVIPGIDFNVNPLPLLMGVTMFWQASLTPPSPGMDPAQQKIMKYFPLIFLFMLYNYSAGLTLYWTVQNLLSIAQMKLTKAEPDAAPPAAVAPALAPRKKR